jgi:hypothetical protein
MNTIQKQKVIQRCPDGEFLPRWEDLEYPIKQPHTHDCIYCRNRAVCDFPPAACLICGPIVCSDCRVQRHILCLDCRRESKVIRGKLLPRLSKQGRCLNCFNKLK